MKKHLGSAGGCVGGAHSAGNPSEGIMGVGEVVGGKTCSTHLPGVGAGGCHFQFIPLTEVFFYKAPDPMVQE